jgi:hypothetical protein
MKKLSIVVALMLVSTLCFGMAMQISKPQSPLTIAEVDSKLRVESILPGLETIPTSKYFTLRYKAGVLYSLEDEKMFEANYLEIVNVNGLNLDVGYAFGADEEQMAAVAIMYDLKELPALVKNVPVVKYVGNIIETIESLPFVEMSIGAYGGYRIDAEKYDAGISSTFLKANW